MVRMVSQQDDAVLELKSQLEDEDLNLEQKILLLNSGLNKVLNMAALHADSSVLTHVKSQLYQSSVLSHCVLALSQVPTELKGSWSAAATLAHITSSCCAGVDPGKRSETFHQLFLPSVMDGLLSLAGHMMKHAEGASSFRKVMDSVGWLLSVHTQLTPQVLSSAHYELIQMCDDEAVSLLCVQMWIQTCSTSRDFLSKLTSDSILLLLNEAVGQLAISSDPAVGGASVKLILLMASQQEQRVQPLLLTFRGLDSLLDKDWRGRGFDKEVNQLITLIQPDKRTRSRSQTYDSLSLKSETERVRAACVIQAAWRAYQTRRRVRSLNRAMSTLQRKYRARRRQQQQQREAQQLEEELRYQVCLRRQQARRKFHQKQRQLLQMLPADQVQPFLQECERRAAVVIQSFWRGFRERRHYEETHRHELRRMQTQTKAARTLQRAVRCFLQRRRAAKAPPIPPFWIGQKGLTDSRRVELKKQVEEYITLHPSSRASPQQCQRLHEEVQLLILSELRRGEQQRRDEERMEALLAHTHTQLELLRDAPPLAAVTSKDAESFLSPSGPIATRARDSHNAMLQASRLPWWKTLGENAATDTFNHGHLQDLEAELGGLFVGGTARTRELSEVDRLDL